MAFNGFAATFRRSFPDIVGRPVLVALSGGADSVALACILHEAAAELGCEVAAAHVHHHLRGAEADADVRHCEALCGRLGMRLAVEHLDPGVPTGVSREAWWRRERYRALEAVRERFSCAAVATAHTLDDQAETVLMKLLRGSGPRGVAGVRRRSGTVIRPLLDVPRAALRGYLSVRTIAWREDASNADLAFPRARVRHELLPALAAAFPGAATHLAAFAAALAEDEAYLGGRAVRARRLARDRPAGAGRGGGGTPTALWRCAGRWSWPGGCPWPSRRPGTSSRPCWRCSTVQVRGPSTSAAGGCCAVAAGCWRCVRRRSRRSRPWPSRCRRAWSWSGGSSGGLVWRALRREGTGPTSALRRRTSPWCGGRSRPASVSGGRSVARLLAAAGVPAEWRRAWPALVAGGTMIWLPAVGVADGWAANGADGVVAGLEEPWERRDR